MSVRIDYQTVKCIGSNIGHFFRNQTNVGSETCTCKGTAAHLRRWIHEMKLQQILNSKGLEKKDNIGQVCPLNFWHRGHQQFIFVRTFREKPKTLTENKIHRTKYVIKIDALEKGN